MILWNEKDTPHEPLRFCLCMIKAKKSKYLLVNPSFVSWCYFKWQYHRTDGVVSNSELHIEQCWYTQRFKHENIYTVSHSVSQCLSNDFTLRGPLLSLSFKIDYFGDSESNMSNLLLGYLTLSPVAILCSVSGLEIEIWEKLFLFSAIGWFSSADKTVLESAVVGSSWARNLLYLCYLYLENFKMTQWWSHSCWQMDQMWFWLWLNPETVFVQSLCMY